MGSPAVARCAALVLTFATLLGGCDEVLGFDKYSIRSQPVGAANSTIECTTHSQCQQQQTADGRLFPNDYCHNHRCVSVRSNDCETVLGPAHDDHAILIGSLFAMSDPQHRSQLALERSALLAVEEINDAGGVALDLSGDSRPLALVLCDSLGDLPGAARHLIDDLGVSAIVGPDRSQDTLDLANQVSIEAGVLLISPSAQAASVAELPDHDLNWVMVPNDVQRMPLMAARVSALEAQLKVERPGRALRLGILLRDDALSEGARSALSSFLWNGEPVGKPSAYSGHARVDSYAPSGEGLEALVKQHASFASDVIVLMGAAETISMIIGPLEQSWLSSEKPHYVISDFSKLPELIELVRGDDDLRKRITGIGVRPTAEAEPNQAAFEHAYEGRFGADDSALGGVSQAYDAVYALTLAYSGARQASPRGEELARGLRMLYGGANTYSLGPAELTSAQQALLRGHSIRALGSLSPLRWDERGALQDGWLEVFCIAAMGGEPRFASSGLSYDIASGQARGMIEPCPSDAIAPAAAPAHVNDAAPAATTCVPPCMSTDVAQDAGTANSSADAPSTDETSRAPATGSEPSVRSLACGSEPCGANINEYCCLSLDTRAATCESVPSDCDYEFSCVRTADCSPGERCCENAGKASCIPASEVCSGAQFECTSARDCLNGQQCCSHVSPDGTAYVATRCEAACNSADSSWSLCQLPTDCPSGSTCRDSNYLPNLRVCNVVR
jgi:branched-chain amino acid transport system substrate-binding protein